MTQKDLADVLHITDKAVSKWERGLCAPDISLLEPLSKALESSIVELIGGERIIKTEYIEEIEVTTKSVIDYSKNEIKYKTKSFKRKYLITSAICIAAAVLICLFALWRVGYFSIIDRSISPDGNNKVTVYDRNIYSDRFFREAATAILVKTQNQGDTSISYGNSTYQGLWWAPDNQKYVLSLKYVEGTYLVLARLEQHSESNLNIELSTGVSMNEPVDYERLNVEYQFLQWSLDSTAMLIYYSFTDVNEDLHSGYFWYNCENGKVYAPFELYAEK
jgi:transcriptional regulator with XRE-family HTH domain